MKRFFKWIFLGHDFFIYTDAEDGVTNVLYRREDGELGLIEAK